MSEAKWQCNNCDHINKFLEQTCEICDKKRPVIKEFTYHILEEFGTIKVSWSIENFIKGNLKYGRKNIDINESKGEIVLKEIRHKKKIVLNTENETCAINEEKIILLKEPEIIKFTSNTLKVLENSFIELIWETKNATNVSISTLGSVSLSGFLKSTTPKSSFKIIAENEVGKSEKEIIIEVLPIPKIKEFTSKTLKLENGKSTQLVWDVEHASNLELIVAGKKEIVSSKGEKTISPTEHSKYKLIITALDGITKVEKEIIVEVYDNVAISDFSSTLYFILEGVEVEFSWDVAHSTNVRIEPEIGTVANIGQFVFRPKHQIYTLIADGHFETIKKEIAIKIVPVPVITTLLVPTPDLNFELDIKLNLPQFPNTDISFNNYSPTLNFTPPSAILYKNEIDTVNLVKLADNALKVDNEFRFKKSVHKINKIIKKLTKQN